MTTSDYNRGYETALRDRANLIAALRRLADNGPFCFPEDAGRCHWCEGTEEYGHAGACDWLIAISALSAHRVAT